MRDSVIAKNLNSPVQINRDREERQPIEAFGCKVIHRIKHHDTSFVSDESGGNSSQNRDSYICGTLYVYERNHIPQSKMSDKDKPFH